MLSWKYTILFDMVSSEVHPSHYFVCHLYAKGNSLVIPGSCTCIFNSFSLKGILHEQIPNMFDAKLLVGNDLNNSNDKFEECNMFVGLQKMRKHREIFERKMLAGKGVALILYVKIGNNTIKGREYQANEF